VLYVELQALPGCRFVDGLHGRWRSFGDVIDDFWSRVVDIDAERIATVSTEGEGTEPAIRWVCKSRHWQRPYYQVLVVRNNGWYYYFFPPTSTKPQA